MAPLLHLIIPLVAFFIAYQWADLYLATITMMGISLIQTLIRLIKKEVIPTEQWVNTITLMILGSMTLFLRNDNFIKLKPTIGYIILAIMLQVTAYRHPKTVLEKTLGETLHLSKQSWVQLNNGWTIFFCLLAVLNLIVAHMTTTSTWVYFKLFGFVGLTVLFIIGQVIYFFYFKKNQISHEFPHR